MIFRPTPDGLNPKDLIAELQAGCVMDKGARKRLNPESLLALAVADQIVLTDEEKNRLAPFQLVALAVADKITLSAHDQSRLSQRELFAMQVAGKV